MKKKGFFIVLSICTKDPCKFMGIFMLVLVLFLVQIESFLTESHESGFPFDLAGWRSVCIAFLGFIWVLDLEKFCW